MKAIILGAGASYDSYYDFLHDPDPNLLNNKFSDGQEAANFYHRRSYPKYRPPLANDLFRPYPEFREVLRRYKEAELLSSSINLHPDLEKYLDQQYSLYNEKKDKYTLIKIYSVLFYLHELFNLISEKYRGVGSSNYEVLVQSAHEYAVRNEEEVLFITFNYETLLENAICQALRKKIRNIDDYISSHLKIYKPHGSCNWLSRINGIKVPQFNQMATFEVICDAIDSNIDFLKTVDNSIIISDNANTFKAEGKIQPLDYYYTLPRMTLPIISKSEFVFPERHLNDLKHHLPLIDDVLIIGWKGGEENFIKLLKENLTNDDVKFNYVLGIPNYEEHNLKKIFPRHQHNFYNGYYAVNAKNDSTYSVYQAGFSSYIINSIRKPSSSMKGFFEL